MPKYQIPESVTAIVIAGATYKTADGVLDIDEAHEAAIAIAARNGFAPLPEADKSTKPAKPVKKAG